MTASDSGICPETDGDKRRLVEGNGDERRDSSPEPPEPGGEHSTPHNKANTVTSVPEGFGWDGLTKSVPVLLLGKAGLLVVFAGWLVGYISDPDTLRNTLYMSLTPLAVMVGFGLKHLYGTVKTIVDESPLDTKDRPVFLINLFSFGGTIGAVLGVLTYSLVPEFDTDSLWGLWHIHRVLGGAALMWVVFAFTLLIRFPFVALVGQQLVDSFDAWEESQHWRTIRKARRIDNGVVALLVVIDIAVIIIRGQEPIPGSILVEVFLVAFTYEAVCALGFRGATIGRWRTSLRLIADDGSRLSRWRALKRSVVLYAPLIVVGLLSLEPRLGAELAILSFLVLLLYQLGGLHPYQRGFADLRTGTQVVAKAPYDASIRCPTSPIQV